MKIQSEDISANIDNRPKSEGCYPGTSLSRPSTSLGMERSSVYSPDETRAKTAPTRTKPRLNAYSAMERNTAMEMAGLRHEGSGFLPTKTETKLKHLLPNLYEKRIDWTKLEEMEKQRDDYGLVLPVKPIESQHILRYLDDEDVLKHEFKAPNRMKSSDPCSTSDVFASHVPQLLIRQFLKNRRPVKDCQIYHMEASVLYINILGYEPMAEKCSAYDFMKAEELKSSLNSFYGMIVRIITRDFGGDSKLFWTTLALSPPPNSKS